MPILFSKVARGNPQNPAAPKKWYPVLKKITQVKEKDVAKQIADETTLNRKEAEMALSQLEKVLINNLLAGNSVQLGDWGSFRITCNGDGSDTADEVVAGKIRKLNIRFSPGKSLTDSLKGATFVSTDSL